MYQRKHAMKTNASRLRQWVGLGARGNKCPMIVCSARAYFPAWILASEAQDQLKHVLHHYQRPPLRPWPPGRLLCY